MLDLRPPLVLACWTYSVVSYSTAMDSSVFLMYTLHFIDFGLEMNIS